MVSADSRRRLFLKLSPLVTFPDYLTQNLGCVGSSAYLSIHNMVAWMIDTNGSDALKEKYLKKLTKFELFSSYCLTEPDSGSDAQAMK